MNNKVVTTLARAFARLGADAVRFNFRGVGASAGRYADGVGEREDALAVVAWCRARWPDRRLYLGGFSFGAAVAAAIAARVAPAGLVTVAPPVDRLPARLRRAELPVAARARRRQTTWCPPRPVIEWCCHARQRRRASCCCRASAISSMAGCPRCASGRSMRSAPTSVRLEVADVLRKLSALFDSAFARDNDDAGAREHALRVATALLLIEVARADYADDFAEDATMLESLKQFFALDDAAATLLLEEARTRGGSRRGAPAVHSPLARAADRSPRSSASSRCCGRWRWRTGGSTSTKITSCAGSPSSYTSRIPISSASATACGAAE